MRAACTVLSLLLALTVLVSPVAALKPSYDFSEGYISSKYYRALTAYELTGDMRHDVVAVAMTQLGYHEGDSDADFDGMNMAGGKNFVEYTRLYGKVDNGEGNGVSYGYAWCAAFVSWCLRQSGVPTAVACTEISCSRMVTWYKNNSTYHAFGDGFVPQTGDIIFFRSSRNTAVSNHVGLVVGVKDGYVYTIEGNSGSVVCTHAFALNDDYIVGYGVPKYTVAVGAEYNFPLTVSGETAGEYIITASSLNVRAGAGTSYNVLGTLAAGERVTVIDFDNGWGRIAYGASDGWISMSYTMSAADIVYSVTYDANGGSNAPLPQRKAPGDSVTLSSGEPKRAGYTFLGWADSASASSPVYVAGDVYSADADMTLYAVWEEIGYVISFVNDDGTVISEKTYRLGEDIVQPEEPVKESDGEFRYVFAGWDKVVTYRARDSRTYTATYEAIPLTDEEKAAVAAQSAAPGDGDGDESPDATLVAVLLAVVLLAVAAGGGAAVYAIRKKRRAAEAAPETLPAAESPAEPAAVSVSVSESPAEPVAVSVSAADAGEKPDGAADNGGDGGDVNT